MSTIKTLILHALISLFISFSSFAQEDCKICGELLKYEITNIDVVQKVRTDFIRSITKENYEEKKRQIKTGAALIVENIPIEVNGDYDSFDKSRSKYFESIHYTHQGEFSEKIFQEKMNEIGLTSFNQCLQICKDVKGIYATIDENAKKYAVVKLRFIGLPESRFTVDTRSSEIINGRMKNTKSNRVPLITLTTTGETKLIISKDNPEEDVVLVINGNQITRSLTIPYVKRFKKFEDPPIVFPLNRYRVTFSTDAANTTFIAANGTSFEPNGATVITGKARLHKDHIIIEGANGDFICDVVTRASDVWIGAQTDPRSNNVVMVLANIKGVLIKHSLTFDPKPYNVIPQQ